MEMCLPSAGLGAVRAASRLLPECKQGLCNANEPTLFLLLKVSHLHVSKYESLLSLKRMVCLLSSAESPVLCLSKRLLQSDVGPHLLDSSATLKFLTGGLVLGSEI